jgi:hypothetical protein
MKRAAVICAILVLTAVRCFAADPPRSEGGDATLRMEELEVRGLREKPGVLYLPVHKGISIPSPVSYDLFLEDMAQPVFPRGISTRTRQADESVGERSAP